MIEQLDEWARKLGARLAGIESKVDRAPLFTQGVVDDYRAGPPRVIDVEVEGGLIPDVPLLTDHPAPTVGVTVWIVRVVGGGWLYHGEQG